MLVGRSKLCGNNVRRGDVNADNGNQNVTSDAVADVSNEMYAKRVNNLQMRARYQCRTRFRGSRFLQCDFCLVAVGKDLDDWIWLNLCWALGLEHSDRKGAGTGSGLVDTEAAPLLSTDRVEGG